MLTAWNGKFGYRGFVIFCEHYIACLTYNRPTRSSSLITLSRPSANSRLQITRRSFYYTAPALWNSLPADLRRLSSHLPSFKHNPKSSVFALSPSQFFKKLKTYLFHYSFPP